MNKRTISLTFSAMALALTLAAAPALASAKDNENADALMRLGAKAGLVIDADGSVAVGGAKVTGVSSSTVSVQSSFGPTVLNWIVSTDASTKFVGGKGAATTTGSVHVGDTISFLGMIDRAASAFAVKASLMFDRTSTSTPPAAKKEKDDQGKHLGWFKAFLKGDLHLFSR